MDKILYCVCLTPRGGLSLFIALNLYKLEQLTRPNWLCYVYPMGSRFICNQASVPIWLCWIIEPSMLPNCHCLYKYCGAIPAHKFRSLVVDLQPLFSVRNLLEGKRMGPYHFWSDSCVFSAAIILHWSHPGRQMKAFWAFISTTRLGKQGTRPRRTSGARVEGCV